MRIIQVTPSAQTSKSGNRTTANRWARIFRSLGHSVSTITNYDDRPADMMVAIHAWRSAAAILRYRERFPGGPLVGGLGGTDINTFLKSLGDISPLGTNKPNFNCFNNPPKRSTSSESGLA